MNLFNSPEFWWAIVSLLLYFLVHFLHKFLLGKNLKEKSKIDELKKSNPKKSYQWEYSWNSYWNTYTKSLYFAKYFFVIMLIICVFRLLQSWK